MPEATRSLPVRVDVRMTEPEREYLTQEAIKRDMSRQDLMRKLLLSELDSVEPVKDYKPLLFHRAVARSTAPWLLCCVNTAACLPQSWRASFAR